MNNIIYETENFVAEAVLKPHVSREEGGHIKISAKEIYLESRTDLTPSLAKEVFRLTMIVGEAMKLALINRGIKIVRINYQEMGNWAYKKNNKPYFHIHLYGRASDAKVQKWPESVYLPDRSTGFYDSFVPLNEEDILEIQKQIDVLLLNDKYNVSEW